MKFQNNKIFFYKIDIKCLAFLITFVYTLYLKRIEEADYLSQIVYQSNYLTGIMLYISITLGISIILDLTEEKDNTLITEDNFLNNFCSDQKEIMEESEVVPVLEFIPAVPNRPKKKYWKNKNAKRKTNT